MSGFYIGIDGKARKVKGGYIGIDGKARKIKKGYIGDANGVARLCYVSSPYDPVFANNSWEDIVDACQKNAVPDTWCVGDQKVMTIQKQDYVFDIIGKNHDEYSDGSGKAPLTFQMHDFSGGDTVMNSIRSNLEGWESSEMRDRLYNELYILPDFIHKSVKQVNKKTSEGAKVATIHTTAEWLFLLSEVEVTGNNKYSFAGEGTQYDYYTNADNRKKSRSWWLRSPYYDSLNHFCVINSYGLNDYQDANYNSGMSYAFCF